MDDYIRDIAVPQVRELFTNYGEVSILWWDTPIDMTPERAAMFDGLVDLQPGIIVNNRLLYGVDGDLRTPEQHIPPTGLDYDWEACMTMNTTWGYKSYDDEWKSSEQLIRNLVDTASKGGNYLWNLTIGHRPDIQQVIAALAGDVDQVPNQLFAGFPFIIVGFVTPRGIHRLTGLPVIIQTGRRNMLLRGSQVTVYAI